MNLDVVHLEQFWVFFSRFKKSLHAPEISGKIYSNLKTTIPFHGAGQNGNNGWLQLGVKFQFKITKHFLISGIIRQ